MSKKAMIEKARAAKPCATNTYRFIGYILMCMGIFVFFHPVLYDVDWIPMVGYFLRHGLHFIIGLVAFIMGTTCTTFVIGMAWIFYRPFFGIPFLLLSAAGHGIMWGL